jgi:hypothetical protein
MENRADEIVSYNDILEYVAPDKLNIDEESPEDTVWRFRDISAHQGPLSPQTQGLQRVANGMC